MKKWNQGQLYLINLILLAFFLFINIKANAQQAEVIYGDDNRLDYYQITNQQIKNIADSTLALVKTNDLKQTSSGYEFKSKTSIGVSRNLCPTEPFRDQPAQAFCSGFLISPELIVTAGHCITSQSACEDISFVFGYHVVAPGVTRTSFMQNEVYHCKSLLGRDQLSQGPDWAVVELDRPVGSKSPLSINKSEEISNNQSLFVIGHPSGLPLKYAPGANVRSIKNGYFVANLDTYGGNSGSAVFNANTNSVEGILVRGETDYEYRNGCQASKRCANNECRGEDVTFIGEICQVSQELCESLGGNDNNSPDEPSTPADNTCRWANDGVCDDGRPGSAFSVCSYGTDSNDCRALGGNDNDQPSSPTGTNTCRWANDGICDDGRAGAPFSVCDYGTDSNDCD